ncbi:MAG TPA: mandelate racemase/muconate lactonizing enzyme family protein [Planctomycetota bacterium]|nr:mandelate racemase/muconate lactonizing enzyme family protein [Planctomycetota bacterium]
MKITAIEIHPVDAIWKNWVFIRVLTDEGLTGLGEATINGFAQATIGAVRDLESLAIGKDPRQVNRIARAVIGTFADTGHIHRLVMAAIETACWDILGKSLGVPIHQLLGGTVRDSVPAYGNGWYRAERTPEAFLAAAEVAVAKGFNALKLDPFGTAQGFLPEGELRQTHAILRALRDRFGPAFKILIDVHSRFTPTEAVRIARRLAELDLFWWEEPTSPDREELTCEVARQCPIPVATGEQFDKVARFETLARGGGVGIWQPEPMSLGGIGPTLAVAHLAEANGAWIAPHQSGGPVATALCLHIAACTPNFLIQEHFLPFNEAWTQDLVNWTPALDPATGHLALPTGPGLGLELDLDVVKAHPYRPGLYFTTQVAGWEKRLGRKAAG